jgi:hypothetical protein
MLRYFGSLLLFFLLATLTSAQADQTFIIDDEDLAHPLTFKELNRSGKHEVKIVRRFADEKEERLLQIAEATYPVESQVRERSKRSAEAPQGNERLWWCSSFDGVRIPFAITKGAVAYYLGVSTEFGKNKPRHHFWTSMMSSRLTYSASLAGKQTYRAGTSEFKNVYIVSMELGWSQYCGPLCAMAFQASRKVILNEEGNVLAIENDTCPPTIVS